MRIRTFKAVALVALCVSLASCDVPSQESDNIEVVLEEGLGTSDDLIDSNSITGSMKEVKKIEKVPIGIGEVDNLEVTSDDAERNEVGFRLGRQINNETHEYLPSPTPDGKVLYFTGMDRTGFFDFKLDFLLQPNAGGEDVFFSNRSKVGFWNDARPVIQICTNGHEAVTQAISSNELVVAGNYPENLGIRDGVSDGTETADLFRVHLNGKNTRVEHFPEPVNSIYNEGDGWIFEDAILFISDRPGGTGEYHLKGWSWEGHYWGNTDVYVALKGEYGWESVIKLPEPINTPGPERTPRLSPDGLTLWVSSWRENEGLEIIRFTRTDKSDWEHWDGPEVLNEVNSNLDDWGYVELSNGERFWSKALPLSFNPTSLAPGGDAGSFRETNFRTGYTLHGRQTASLVRTTQSEIFAGTIKSGADLILHNIQFEFDSDALKSSELKELELLVEICRMNQKSIIVVTGHTDNIGDDDYNMELSKRRADAVANFLKKNGIESTIKTKGMGASSPLEFGMSEKAREKNRRVEIEFQEA